MTDFDARARALFCQDCREGRPRVVDGEGVWHPLYSDGSEDADGCEAEDDSLVERVAAALREAEERGARKEREAIVEQLRFEERCVDADAARCNDTMSETHCALRGGVGRALAVVAARGKTP